MPKMVAMQERQWTTDYTLFLQTTQQLQAATSKGAPKVKAADAKRDSKGAGKRGHDGDQSRTAAKAEKAGQRATGTVKEAKGKFGDALVKVHTAKKGPDGKAHIYCRAYGTPEGCDKTWRECRKRHKCDILLDGGETCDMIHSRSAHKEGANGKALTV